MSTSVPIRRFPRLTTPSPSGLLPHNHSERPVMRLICGFLYLDGRPAGRERLDAMAAAMVGPGLAPETTRRIEGPVALATLDFAAGGSARDEPRREGSDLLLAADVRLDEPDRLAGSLGLPRPRAGAAGDEALLLAVLERWGTDGIARVLGDFSVALWDPRSQSLTCARDAFGVRPFYILHRPGEVFAFASLPCGLHAGGFAPRELDEDYLLAPLAGGFFGPERSLFRGVERVAPGGLLRVSARGVERGHHWRLDPAMAGRRSIRPEEAAEELAALITEAVRCRLPARGSAAGEPAGEPAREPVAAHLSGGLDSSALAILAARMLRREGRSLLGYSFLPSAVGDYDPPGERPYVEAVLRQEPDIVWSPIHLGDPASFVLPEMEPDQAQPRHPMDPEVQVFTDAAAKGARILLSGWGGDQGATFDGRGALAEALLAGHWRILAGEFRALKTQRGWSPLVVLRRRLLNHLLPEGLYVRARCLMGRPPVRRDPTALLRPEIAARLSLPRFRPGPDAVANRLHLLGSRIVARRAEQWAQMAARHGMAVTFPMLDRRVVEFALSLPSALFHRGGWPRRVFRDAMADILPPEIRWRQDKLNAFPEFPLVVAGQRDFLLERLVELRRHPRVAALFDLDRIETAVRMLPEPEEVVQRAAVLCADQVFGMETLRMKRVLDCIAYVQQHC